VTPRTEAEWRAWLAARAIDPGTAVAIVSRRTHRPLSRWTPPGYQRRGAALIVVV